MSAMLTTVGENIRRMRKEKGVNQKELADAIGISQQMMSQYESGTRFETILEHIEFYGRIILSIVANNSR